MQIRVAPDALSAAGREMAAQSAAVESARSTASSAASGTAAACGFPEPEAAFARLWSRWSPALAGCADDVAGLGRNLEAAGFAYRITDLSAMPEG